MEKYFCVKQFLQKYSAHNKSCSKLCNLPENPIWGWESADKWDRQPDFCVVGKWQVTHCIGKVRLKGMKYRVVQKRLHQVCARLVPLIFFSTFSLNFFSAKSIKEMPKRVNWVGCCKCDTSKSSVTFWDKRLPAWRNWICLLKLDLAREQNAVCWDEKKPQVKITYLILSQVCLKYPILCQVHLFKGWVKPFAKVMNKVVAVRGKPRICLQTDKSYLFGILERWILFFGVFSLTKRAKEVFMNQRIKHAVT